MKIGFQSSIFVVVNFSVVVIFDKDIEVGKLKFGQVILFFDLDDDDDVLINNGLEFLGKGIL